MIRHLANIASVGPLLVKGLVARGVPAEMIEIQASSRLGRHWGRAVTFRAAAGHPDPIHLHYALFSAYLMGKRPAEVVHCHGTDVRPNLEVPLYRRLTLPGLRRAKLVIYSTPDLGSFLQAESIAAHYLPNPVDVVAGTSREPGHGVLLFARLDRFKGGEALLEAGRRLLALGVDVTTVGWGELAAEAKEIDGLRVLPFMERDEVSEVLRQHAIVVGQIGDGFLSMSELESMAAGRPLVMHHGDWAEVPELPPVVEANDPASIVEAVTRLLSNSSQRIRLGEQGQDWVASHHGVGVVVDRLLGLYEEAGVEV